MLKELKDVAVRGNVMDIAIGIMIGAAFGKIINCFVEHLFVPLLGFVTMGLDLREKLIILKPATETSKAVTVNYGILLMTVIDFVAIAFAIFWVVRAINILKRQGQLANPITKNCPECMMPIPIQARRCGHCASATQ